MLQLSASRLARAGAQAPVQAVNAAQPPKLPPTAQLQAYAANKMPEQADLAQAMVTQKTATYAFEANLKMFKTQDTLKGVWLDTHA
mgnify:CR=1 FL=1